jgi:stage III sporulation protein AG
VYQTDEDITTSENNSTVRKETVIITDSQRNESPLVLQVLPPEYMGAVIVCQGAENVQVRLAIVEAVCNATGLGADKIAVLKMK